MFSSNKYIIFSVLLLFLSTGLAFFIVRTEGENSRFAFRFGLDLKGGSHLVYNADVSGLGDGRSVDDAMSSLREVIERRVNIFGVSEPIVQIERGGLAGEENRLIVELPGITDLKEAVQLIGKTPLLEFKLMSDESSAEPDSEGEILMNLEEIFVDTGLTGRMLDRARLEFDQTTREPIVLISFNSEGRALFAEITRNNIGKPLAIFLDGEPISIPIVREEIRDGNAQISGNFSPQEGRDLVRDLNFGALPVPIELISTQSIGASLGEKILDEGVRAGVFGFALVVLFMIVWYRLPGFLASLSLVAYVILMLALFKLIPVTLTAAGIAGFILSIGMAIDANVLIFERMKEELRSGKKREQAIKDGFSRAWLSIRDSNVSSLITAVILFFIATSLVKGFALIFGLGVLISMISAIFITRTFLLAVATENPKTDFLFGSGTKKSK